MSSRYLTSPRGAALESRLWPTVRLFGGLFGIPAGCGVVIAVSAALDVPIVAALAIGVMILSMLTATVLQWVYIFGSTSRLRKAEEHLRGGSLAVAVGLAQWVLARVFRADFRTRAFYVLALAAERAGDFADAAYLFRCAMRALPAFAGKSHAVRLRALAASHEAFALAACGRDAEAERALAVAHGALPLLGQRGLLEALDDPALGPLSMNATLSDIEGRRDPRAVATLAGALLAWKRRDPQRALNAFTGEAQMLSYNTLPHEQHLLARLEASSIAMLGGAQYRGGAVVGAGSVDPATDAWVSAVLGQTS
ncbi:MAG: hypothetical protein IPF92_01400 [Myxococcales bacterium]|nr:hypothetical protein [Myxococcales bacterium]MBL0193787.1 hypothetical protein [Myxococcales bacterium]HQY61051.1 hypothetical protein [Polyangiaceae bacterium]